MYNNTARAVMLGRYCLPYIKGGAAESGGGIQMERKHNKELVSYAKELRKNMTREEKHLWYDFLSTYSVRFMRQRVLGKYIADFYCAKAKLVVELDGSQHYTEEAKEYDAQRALYLEQYGIKVLRFLNKDVNDNFDGVCNYIDIVAKNRIKNLQE